MKVLTPSINNNYLHFINPVIVKINPTLRFLLNEGRELLSINNEMNLLNNHSYSNLLNELLAKRKNLKIAGL